MTDYISDAVITGVMPIQSGGVLVRVAWEHEYLKDGSIEYHKYATIHFSEDMCDEIWKYIGLPRGI